jgi:hypothetical protein
MALPDGRTERPVLQDEFITAAKEFRRLTQAYLSKARELYPKKNGTAEAAMYSDASASS